MRNIIIDIIEKLIVPKYGPLDFNVVYTNDFSSSSSKGLAYAVVYRDFPPNLEKNIIKETKMIFEMLGLKNIRRSYYGLGIAEDAIQIVGEDK